MRVFNNNFIKNHIEYSYFYLCAYIQGIYSGRQIENLLIDSLRMRYLSQNQLPNFRTINRRVHPIMNNILDHAFIPFRELLVKSGLISIH